LLHQHGHLIQSDRLVGCCCSRLLLHVLLLIQGQCFRVSITHGSISVIWHYRCSRSNSCCSGCTSCCCCGCRTVTSMLLALLALLLLLQLFGLSSFPLLLAGDCCLALLALHIAEVKIQQCQ
jgi:hypothetical protein